MAKRVEPDSVPTVVNPVEAPTANVQPPLSPPGAKLTPSTVIGRYVIIESVGEGGMGVVYVALDPDLNRKVALKLLRPEAGGAGASEGRNRFVREAHAMAKLSHPNVVAIYDAGVYGEEVFLAMELVEGTDLGTWLDRAHPSWREILSVFIKAGRGLAAAHAAGLVHRDFKPANVMIGRSGEVKVTDFGLARAADLAEQEDGAISGSLGDELLDSPLTRKGVVTGTPAFMAPEQMTGRPGDARTDEFSFSVALFRSLYGERPFDSWEEQLKAAPVKPAPAGSAVPGWVRRALLKGMARIPADRFATLEGLLEALSDDPALRRRKMVEFVAMVVLIIATAAASVLIVLRQRAKSDSCYDPPARLARVWDEEARKRVRAAFAATGVFDAATTAIYAEKAMDRAAGAWTAAYQDACRVTRVEHRQPESALGLRLDCLEDQRINIGAASQIMEHPDGGNLSSAIGAAVTLPLPLECADAQALSVVEQPDPARRPQIDALRLTLAQGRSLTGAGRLAQAVAVLQPLPEQAHQLDAHALEAQAYYALGRAQVDLAGPDDIQKAIASYVKAESLAESSRMDTLATYTASAIAWNEATQGSPAPEVDAALERARASLRRVGTGGGAELSVEDATAIVEWSRGHDQPAVEAARAALKLSEKLYGSDHPATLGVENTLSLALEPSGQYDQIVDLLRKAVAGYDAILGPGNKRAAVPHTNLAEVLFDMGRLSDCDRTLSELFVRLGPGDDGNAASALAVQAASLAREGKREESLASAHRATEMAARLHMAARPTELDIPQYLSEAWLYDGEPALALAEFKQYLAGQDLPADSPDWVGLLRLGGWAYLDAGRTKAALPVLERALRLSAAHPFYPGWVPRLRFQTAKALVLTGGDRKRAAGLAQAAHDELQSLSGEKALLEEVVAWQAKN